MGTQAIKDIPKIKSMQELIDAEIDLSLIELKKRIERSRVLFDLFITELEIDRSGPVSWNDIGRAYKELQEVEQEMYKKFLEDNSPEIEGGVD